MISTFFKFGLAPMLLTVLTMASWVLAAVEITPQKTLKTDGIPVDVAVSQDGNLTFVQTIRPTQPIATTTTLQQQG